MIIVTQTNTARAVLKTKSMVLVWPVGRIVSASRAPTQNLACIRNTATHAIPLNARAVISSCIVNFVVTASGETVSVFLGVLLSLLDSQISKLIILLCLR